MARRAALHSRCDLPKSRIAPKRVGDGKSRCVEEVEELATDFQPHAFPGNKCFFDGDINVVNSIGSEAGKISRCVPRLLVTRVCEAVRIQSALPGESGLMS